MGGKTLHVGVRRSTPPADRGRLGSGVDAELWHPARTRAGGRRPARHARAVGRLRRAGREP
eukprot:9292954-Lingulodinium_polyedra.AAC.1